MGTRTGISMMPILPRLCGTDENLEATIRCTAEHGGCSVIAGGLTLAAPPTSTAPSTNWTPPPAAGTVCEACP